ncbi:hypothetical protein H920_08741 [Fukomys damarensis]|uniref:Uncharacterized protein n=1 Tax=Fukomys damarensis TaxID=885580 RepID=A0A091DHV4_FUKDA|nr:hypothetical protein H920_08741 [Fukomys damarensis]
MDTLVAVGALLAMEGDLSFLTYPENPNFLAAAFAYSGGLTNLYQDYEKQTLLLALEEPSLQLYPYKQHSGLEDESSMDAEESFGRATTVDNCITSRLFTNCI